MNAFMAMTALFGGVGLGVLFFGGLHFSVRRGVASTAPALWFLASFWLRTAAILTGFYALSRTDWWQLPLCLLGFLAARSVCIHVPTLLRYVRQATARTPWT